MDRAGTLKAVDIILQRAIIEDENGEEICFSLLGVFEILNLGDRITFDIALADGGLEAVNVVPQSTGTILSHA